MKKYQIDVQRLVGLEGFFGIVYIFVIIFIMSFVPCPNKLMCDIYGPLEDPIVAFYDMFRRPEIFWVSMVIVVGILFININCQYLTKHVSCVYSAFWMATRTVCVWIFSVILQLETLSYPSSLIQFFGFVLLVTGNLTYNEIIEWKCFGINSQMEKYRIKFNRKKKMKVRDMEFEQLQRGSFLRYAEDKDKENTARSLQGLNQPRKNSSTEKLSMDNNKQTGSRCPDSFISGNGSLFSQT